MFTVLKKAPLKVIEHIQTICNAILKTRTFPNHWKTAETILILKPNKPTNLATSYRPISLLNNIGKIAEKTLYSKIIDMVNTNQIPPKEQFRFRTRHSTTQQLMRITNFIKENLNNSRPTKAIFLDVAKAFEWHKGLINKIK